jgi:hypothetical protein
MAQRAGQLNFAKGEIAEELIARIDVASYQSGVKTANNVIVMKYGGLKKRPGTRLVAEAWDATHPVRLIPFQFSLVQAFALEFGQNYMRPAATGGLVLEQKIKVTAITKATNAKITAAYHAYTVGQQVFFSGITGMTEINGKFGKVMSVVDADNFTVNINTTGFSTFTGSDGTTRSAPPSPPPAPPPSPPPPAPAPPPPPPADTGGGGGFDDGGPCVTVDTLILMADKSLKPAGEIRTGDRIWSQPENGDEWGEYRVTAAAIVRDEDLLRATIDGKELCGTPNHRVRVDGEWMTLVDLGAAPDGVGDVVKLSTTSKTYVSNGILSHNLKPAI